MNRTSGMDSRKRVLVHQKSNSQGGIEMSDREIGDDEQMALEQCRVMCPRCNAKWVTSLGVEYCDCLHCGTKLNPLKHIIANDETEVN